MMLLPKVITNIDYEILDETSLNRKLLREVFKGFYSRSVHGIRNKIKQLGHDYYSDSFLALWIEEEMIIPTETKDDHFILNIDYFRLGVINLETQIKYDFFESKIQNLVRNKIYVRTVILNDYNPMFKIFAKKKNSLSRSFKLTEFNTYLAYCEAIVVFNSGQDLRPLQNYAEAHFLKLAIIQTTIHNID